MTTMNEMRIICDDPDTAKAKQRVDYQARQKRGELVHRHVITDVENKTIKYVVDKIIQRTSYIVPAAGA